MRISLLSVLVISCLTIVSAFEPAWPSWWDQDETDQPRNGRQRYEERTQPQEGYGYDGYDAGFGERYDVPREPVNSRSRPTNDEYERSGYEPELQFRPPQRRQRPEYESEIQSRSPQRRQQPEYDDQSIRSRSDIRRRRPEYEPEVQSRSEIRRQRPDYEPEVQSRTTPRRLRVKKQQSKQEQQRPVAQGRQDDLQVKEDNDVRDNQKQYYRPASGPAFQIATNIDELKEQEALDRIDPIPYPSSYDDHVPLEQRGIQEAVFNEANSYKPDGVYQTEDRLEFQIHGHQGPHSYRYGYDTGNGYNRQFRYEERDDNGYVKGRYGFFDRYGKLQIVNYSADPYKGFKADGAHVPRH